MAECKCRWLKSTTPCRPHSHVRYTVTSEWHCVEHLHEEPGE